MHWAAISGREKVCAVLLQHDAKVDALDIIDKTPLYYALCEGHDKLCEVLLQNGAKVSALKI